MDDRSSFNQSDSGSPLSERSSTDSPEYFQKTREEDDETDSVEDLDMVSDAIIIIGTTDIDE